MWCGCSPGFFRLFPLVVVEQAVRIKPNKLLLLVVQEGRREQLDEVEIGEERYAVVDGGPADGVVVLQSLAVGGGQVYHQVDLLAADVADHVRTVLLKEQKTKQHKRTFVFSERAKQAEQSRLVAKTIEG